MKFAGESLAGRRWRFRGAADGGALAAALSLHPRAAEVFAARGLDAAFFATGRAALLDPGGILGLERGVARIGDARLRGEAIRLVTDYDVDGTTSCLILHAALDALGGANVSYHIPDRFTEGYGLSTLAVERAAADGVRLLVTADIGVRDHAAVRRARELGLDVVVCDHHLPAGESVPPDAVAVLCPPQDGCGYANKALAACGVSLKLATALLSEHPRRDSILASMLKLAAIGTVADIVSLATPENRAIVSLGLGALNAGPHSPGLAALLGVSGAEPGNIDAQTIGWRIGPRINAAGRLADANAVVRLLRERDPAAARAGAAMLDELNRERQDISGALVDLAMAQVADPPPGFVVVHGREEDGFHRGVVGIVAAKVRERVGRPVAIVSVVGNTAVGSVRSVPGVHAVRALDAVAALLHRYGGHAAAAGFSLDAARVPELAEGLDRWVNAHHDVNDMAEDDVVDLVLRPLDVSMSLVKDLGRLEPCGKDNPPAKVVVESAPSRVRVMKDKHLGFSLGDVRAVWWGAVEHREALEGARQFLGSLSINRWQGREEVQLVVDDAR